jgi:hypothetical protein
MRNIQVTHDTSLDNARSESSLVINPNNPQQIVAGSKKFNNYHTYDFTLATAYSTDGGQTWADSTVLDLPTGWYGISDPALAWDDAGNVFLVALPLKEPPPHPLSLAVGIAVYKSTDGGQTWGQPKLIHTSDSDDKQWAAGDGNPGSPFHGRVYAAWDGPGGLCFARTLDHGGTWIGTGASPAGTSIAPSSFSPEVNVAADGTVYIIFQVGSEIKMVKSTDGGNSFQAAASPATGIGAFGIITLLGGNFRVAQVPTACDSGSTVIVAWSDNREGNLRIYYAVSTDGGASWNTPPSGQPLLAGLPIDPNMFHFHPQIVFRPNGVLGCAFYEFGPKPTVSKIDTRMALSFDNGISFSQLFTVTDQPWDPTVDAPWSHGHSNLTFIGEYFGFDASDNGFYPLWTDTRTGIQELWMDIMPQKTCAFIVERSTFGQDEIDARRAGVPGHHAVVPDAFRVVVDGFTAAELSLTAATNMLNVASPTPGMTIICTGNTSATGGYGAEVQRFTFHYNIDFGKKDTAFNFTQPTETLTLTAAIATVAASAQIELIKQPNPFILHGDPAWLSIDLRVFHVKAGESRFGATMGPDATSAPQYIKNVIQNFTTGHGIAGGEAFDGLPAAEEQSAIYVFPTDGPNGTGNKVFNFALAKVHYIGTIGAANVRVFFRLFTCQTTTAAYDQSTSYRRWPTNPAGQPIPLAGIRGNEYVTMPFFAEARVNSTALNMNQQTDPANIQSFTPTGGAEVDVFYGCWLDINQPLKPDGSANNVLPVLVPGINNDGPFSNALPIQQAIMRNPHQCFVAEIAFDPISIPPGKDPSNWDKLAQRNLAWSDLPNPGVDGSRRALNTFEVRPSAFGLQHDRTPDEIMIDWNSLPVGTTASIYLPAVLANEVIAMASRMYTAHDLGASDEHTIECAARGITYIPVPTGSGIDFAGLLSVNLPPKIRRGQVFNIVVRQVTDAFGLRKPPNPEGKGRRRAAPSAVGRSEIRWRRTVGAFELAIPIHAKEVLLEPEERVLSLLRWVQKAIPKQSRWFSVFERYLGYIGDRVIGLGGDPTQVPASPFGDTETKPSRPEPCGPEARIHCTGKVSSLIFDRFGDFEGFLLDTEDGERKFFSRENEIEELVERAWCERLRMTVFVERDQPHRPLSIIVREPPAPFWH